MNVFSLIYRRPCGVSQISCVGGPGRFVLPIQITNPFQPRKMQLDLDMEPTFRFTYMRYYIDKHKDITV